MSADLSAVFLRAVRESGLVDPGRVDDLAALAAGAGADAQGLVKELRRRGWLTDFQIREIARGRGGDLTLGPYQLAELIGEGGMGRVYRARHARLGRDVALKVIRQEKLGKPSAVTRFRREIRAAAQLSHPNVVLAFDADEADGTHYYAMELVDGTDLARLVKDSGPVPVPLACDYARQAALGLQHAHERGLIHRDIKPANLLLTPRGQVKLTDLGLAMLHDPADADGDGRVSQPGLVLGTPDFLAPEQAQDPLNVDGRADIYALGATLYFLVTGKVPYDGPSATDKLIAHINDPPPSVLAALPDAPPGLDAVVKWLMAKNPADRPQTPAQAAYALAALAGGVGTPAAESPPEPDAVPPAEVAPVADDGFSFDPSPVAAAAVGPEMPTVAVRVPVRPGQPVGRRVVALGLAAVVGTAAVAGVAAVVFSASGPVEDQPLPDKFTNTFGIPMVRVAGGKFLRGAPAGEPGAGPADGPAADVTVAGPFFVGTTEVTGGQFRQVTGRSPGKSSTRLRKWNETPVDSVTWDEAAEFCRKLTADDKGVRPGWAYRLPTEAEWEYVCRAGTATPFSSGATLVYGAGGIFTLTPGGLGEEDVTKPKMERGVPYPAGASAANALGVHDCHGNVWEWTADPFTPDLSTQPPTNPAPGAFRTIRGGSWRTPAADCRSASRRGLVPDARQDDVGFRVVLAPGGG